MPRERPLDWREGVKLTLFSVIWHQAFWSRSAITTTGRSDYVRVASIRCLCL